MATEMRKTGGGRLLNNMTTGLTVAPLILMTAERGLARLRRCRAQRYVEFALLAVGLGGPLYLTHTWATVGAGRIPFQLYGPLPFLLWAAVRFGPDGLCLFLLFVVAHATSETISGRRPYVAQTPAENVLALQISLAVLAIPLMFVAALIGERRKKEEALREIEDRLKRMADSIPEVIWIMDLAGGASRIYEPELRACLGSSARRPVPKPTPLDGNDSSGRSSARRQHLLRVDRGC